MNDSLRRTLALVVLGAAVWGGWYGWQSWKTRQALEALENVVRSADLNKLLSDPPEEVKNTVDLAVRGIMLSQGNEGRKSFDLKADWATLNQDSGAITVRDPDIHYMLENAGGGEARVIRATSDVGRVEDGNQKVSMSGKVHATYEENVLTGDLAVFLNTNILTGDQGVRMRWTPSDTDTSGGAADADTLPENAQNDAQKESRS